MLTIFMQRLHGRSVGEPDGFFIPYFWPFFDVKMQKKAEKCRKMQKNAKKMQKNLHI